MINHRAAHQPAAELTVTRAPVRLRRTVRGSAPRNPEGKEATGISPWSFTNLTGQPVPGQWLRSAWQAVVKRYAPLGRRPVSVVLVTTAKIKKLNGLYHGQFKITDVLSFDYKLTPHLADGGIEIIICYPQAKKQAQELSWPIKRELQLLFIHGLLHQLGFNDDTLRRQVRMRQQESALLHTLAA